MKPQRLVPMFILALTLPGYVWAGSGAAQKGACGCSQTHKVAQKASRCGCGARPKHVQKSPASKCGCGSVQKGKGQPSAKGPGIIQKKTGSLQKQTSVQKSSVQKSSVQKSSVQKSSVQKSKGGCSTCCLDSISAVVVNGLEHVLSGTLQHLSAAFACNSCGNAGKSKSGLLSLHLSRSKSKGCGCSDSLKVAPAGVPPNPFNDDVLQAPPMLDREASHRIERRPVHRQVFRTRATARVARSEPHTLSISVAKPLTLAKPKSAITLRVISVNGRSSSLPHNPLRAK